MAYTKQVKAASVLNNAFSSSYVGGDGVSLCNASHPLVSGGTNSNRLTAADLNETRKKLQYDLDYLERFGPYIDLKIALLTCLVYLDPKYVR